MPKEKHRLDEWLLLLELASNLEEAQSLILSGSVLVNDRVCTKSGFQFSIDDRIRIRERIGKYVSRGAYKLKKALEEWNIGVQGRICVDLGASTGGFTEVLLENGAAKVFAIDVGYGQMATRIRNRPEVVSLDRHHAKDLTWDLIGGQQKHLFIVADLSFISILKIFPVIHKLAEEMPDSNLEVVSLIKPQFEASSAQLEKGIVFRTIDRIFLLLRVLRFLKREMHIKNVDLTKSPIQGAAGNIEYLVHWKY